MTIKRVTGYHVTDVDKNGTRFKRTYNANSLQWTLGINLWRGSVWVVYSDNTRRRIKQTYN